MLWCCGNLASAPAQALLPPVGLGAGDRSSLSFLYLVAAPHGPGEAWKGSPQVDLDVWWLGAPTKHMVRKDASGGFSPQGRSLGQPRMLSLGSCEFLPCPRWKPLSVPCLPQWSVD